ncbi:hypothetical protein RMCBS344292_05272 [Rhizopus microsporus]|nr:hypothetical protein RMCBS344292_05272 [Rhizopus microsporus]
MTFISTATEGDNSWIKKRTSIFTNPATTSSTTTNNSSVNKVVDKELARLKNIGAVSSVWSNKFVQEDSGGRNTNRQSVNSNQSTSPKSPTFNIRARTLSGNNKELAKEISAALQQQHDNKPPASNRLTTGSVSSFELNQDNRSSSGSVISNSSQVTVNSSASAQSSTSNTSATVDLDEAASLWFQCETLKTQYAQINARLNRANEDIAFYKRQLENLDASTREGLAAAAEERDKEVERVKQLAELIIKQDELLSEYEVSLEHLRKSATEVAAANSDDGAKAEIEALRHELTGLYRQKEEMECAITALRAELEMSYSQMRLMMVVSTEIQNEFDSYKKRMDVEIKELIAEKQQEHKKEMEALEQKLTTNPVQREIVHHASSDDSSLEELEALRKQVNDLIDAAEEKDKANKLAVVEHENTLKIVQEQVSELKELKQALEEKDKVISEAAASSQKTIQSLQSQIQELSQTLEHKNKIIADLENQMKAQKMNMDSQMMDLTQSILEKDALLLEFMSSRNNSSESNVMCASPTTTTEKPAFNNDTDTFYQRQTEAHRQMSQVRDYMYTTSSDEEELDAYSSDEETAHPVHQYHAYNSTNNTHSDNKSISSITHGEHAPQSPADTISSSITFDSSDEEEQVAEIKHLSYSSVHSQSTLSLHSHSSTAIGSSQSPEEEKRNSNSSNTLSPYSAVKDTSAKATSSSWPMPPPTPPPSEPLPPLPVPSSGNEPVTSAVVPPPRRARSKTMVREESPSPYTTSIHKSNELPRIVPLQKDTMIDTMPVPPPRKDIRHTTSESTSQVSSNPPLNTKWMDDPESEEEHWSEAQSH